jgi:hypothetical protein
MWSGVRLVIVDAPLAADFNAAHSSWLIFRTGAFFEPGLI